MKKFGLVILLVLGLALGGCAAGSNSAAAGTLQGHVDIGPLTPVERPGETVTVPPSVYATVKILVYGADGATLLQTLSLSDQGDYQAELAPGNYRVDFNRDSIRKSADVPRDITITSGATVTLSINIDTGIR